MQHAWQASSPAFDIQFRGETACGAGVDLSVIRESDVLYTDALSGTGIVLTVNGSNGQQSSPFQNLSLALGPQLHAANFSAKDLVPGAVSAFSDFKGRLAAFPLLLAEVQFYVNPRALAPTGLTAPGPWTVARLEEAIRAVGAHQPTSRVPLVVGIGWADVNVWASWVQGSGGLIGWKIEAVDLTGAVAPTEALVRLAQRARWDPFPTFAAGTPAGDFVRYGFARSAADAVFALAEPPYLTGMVRGGLSSHRTGSATPVQSAISGSGVVRIPFPTFGTGAPAPGVDAVGLALSSSSTHGTLAAEFMTWLYAPPQQRLLAGLGFPPLTGDANTQAYWAQLAGKSGSASGWFDPNRYWDVLPQVPAEDLGSWTSSITSVNSAGVQVEDFGLTCQAMYRGQDVKTAMATFQRALDQAPLPFPAVACPASPGRAG